MPHWSAGLLIIRNWEQEELELKFNWKNLYKYSLWLSLFHQYLGHVFIICGRIQWCDIEFWFRFCVSPMALHFFIHTRDTVSYTGSRDAGVNETLSYSLESCSSKRCKLLQKGTAQLTYWKKYLFELLPNCYFAILCSKVEKL